MTVPKRNTQPQRNRVATSLFLSLVIIGSTVSATALFDLTILPKEGWAVSPNTPTGLNPADNFATFDTMPTFTWACVMGVNPAVSYQIQINDDSNIRTIFIDTIPPTAQSITSPTAGTQNTDITEISGTSGEAGLTIEVFNGATSLGTTTSGTGGA